MQDDGFKIVIDRIASATGRIKVASEIISRDVEETQKTKAEYSKLKAEVAEALNDLDDLIRSLEKWAR